MNLADELRRESESAFESIKQKLTDMVVEHIRKSGHISMCVYTDEKEGIKVHNYYGIYIDKSFRVAAIKHFKELGFKVSEDFFLGGAPKSITIIL